MSYENSDYSHLFDGIYFDYSIDFGNASDYENVSNYDYYYSGRVERIEQNIYFPGYDPDTADRLLWCYQTISDFLIYLSNRGAAISLVGLVFNILHIIVLTRKPMFNNSVNLILVVIAINDIMGFILEIYGKDDQIYKMLGLECIVPDYGTDCLPYNIFQKTLSEFVQDTLKRHFQRMSAWLAILMALIRALCITNADNPSFSFLSTMKFGYYLIFVEFLICAFTSSLCIFQYLIWYPIRDPDPSTQFLWERSDSCFGYSPVEKQMEYSFNTQPEITRPIYIIDGISIKIIPCLCYPVLTALLIRKLIQMKATRKRLNQKNMSDRSTYLVIGMTVTFMIAEIPQAIGYILSTFETSGMSFMGTMLMYSFAYISYLNGTIHCFICFLLSSLYRSTVYELLFINKIKCKSGVVANKMETTQVRSESKTTENRR